MVAILNVTLPEWITIGLALSRLDTPQGYALLERLTDEITGQKALSNLPKDEGDA